jgi:8-oxo-dGTP diphosphatase
VRVEWVNMKLLAEINRTPGIPHDGRAVHREAVRGIILKGENILLIYSTLDGDYKFPGGGVKPGEDHLTALAREINEESGATMLSVQGEFGKTIEYDHATEKDRDVFIMTSYHYLVKIDPTLGMQDLEDYETELGFTPMWVSLHEAITSNRALLIDRSKSVQRWVQRETSVLEMVEQELIRR